METLDHQQMYWEAERVEVVFKICIYGIYEINE